MSEILSLDGVIFYRGGSLCEGSAGDECFWIPKNLTYKGIFCIWFSKQRNMHNMTIFICSDSKAALSSYTISSKLLHQCWLSLQNLSNYRVGCFGCQVSATLRAMRRLIGWREWARTPTSVNRSFVIHCQLQLSGI
jgi:hypothetical protein